MPLVCAVLPPDPMACLDPVFWCRSCFEVEVSAKGQTCSGCRFEQDSADHLSASMAGLSHDDRSDDGADEPTTADYGSEG